MPRALYLGNKVLLFSLLTILLTGILVAVSATLPMYHSVRTHIEQVNLTNARARADVIENHFIRYASLAAQFTSRTEIRKRLEAYLEGTISLQELQDFSGPRLAEPARHIPDLLAMLRVTPEQQLVAAVGRLAEAVQPLGYAAGTPQLVRLQELGIDAVRVTAPVINAKGVQVGLDILYFDAQGLAPAFKEFATHGKDAKLSIVSKNGEVLLGYELASESVAQQKYSPQLQRVLDALDLHQTHMLSYQSGLQLTLLYIPLTQLEAGLLIEIPQSVFYRAAYHDIFWVLLSVLGMLVLGALISHYTVRPLVSRLMAQAVQIEKDARQLYLAGSVFNLTQQAIVITDTRLDIVRANQGAKKVLGVTEDTTMLRRNLKEFIREGLCDNDLVLTEDFLLLLEREGSWQGEVCYCLPEVGPGVIPTLQNITLVRESESYPGYLIHIFSDITERKAIQEEVTQLAHYDALTGLPNRHTLTRHLLESVQAGGCFAVLFIDLDKFKPVNDVYGHQAGDQVLKEVAQRIRSVVRNRDMVGRLGGDEFLMIIGSAQDALNTDVVANKIITEVIKPYTFDSNSLTIGVSIGIAYYPRDASNVDELIMAADSAMYKAKHRGGNCYDHYAKGDSMSCTEAKQD